MCRTVAPTATPRPGRPEVRPSSVQAGARPVPGPSDVFAGHGLRTVFQPVVDLVSGAVVGHEALTRVPKHGPWPDPTSLVAEARRAGRLVELDWACRSLALRSACAAGLDPPSLLFVNAEPESLAAPCPAALLPELAVAHRRLDVVVEVTERHLLHRPDRLVRAVEAVRGLGWQVALDDVGATDAGLALLPVLRPDIVKLDRALLATTGDDGERMRTLSAVRRYADDTGARVVAEGIETPADLRRAVQAGAGWGQGYLLGRPGPLEGGPDGGSDGGAAVPGSPAARAPVRAGRPSVDLGEGNGSAFTLLSARAPTTTDAVGPDERIGLLGEQAGDAPRSALLLVSAGRDRLLPQTWAQLAELHDVCALVSVLSVPPPPRRLPWVRVSRLLPDDPLAGECCAVLLSPTHAVAVAGRPTGPGTWRTVRSEDPVVVALLARLLMARTGAVSYDCWQ